MPDKEIEQNFMFVKPEFIDHWSYQIDEGKKHLLREDDVYPYVKGFLNGPKEWAEVVSIIQRHQPFIIFLKKGTLRELHPKEDTKSYHKDQIAKDLAYAARGIETEGTILGGLNKGLDYDPSSNRREDALDRALKQHIRNSQNNELSSSILQRRLK